MPILALKCFRNKHLYTCQALIRIARYKKLCTINPFFFANTEHKNEWLMIVTLPALCTKRCNLAGGFPANVKVEGCICKLERSEMRRNCAIPIANDCFDIFQLLRI